MKRLNAGDLLRGGPLRESCVEDGTQTVRRSQPQKDEGTRRGGDGLCKVQVMVLPLTCSVTFVTLLNPSLSQFPRLQNGDTLFLMVVRVKWIYIKCLEPSTYYKFNKHRQFWFPEQRESENRVWKSGQESHCVCELGVICSGDLLAGDWFTRFIHSGTYPDPATNSPLENDIKGAWE